MTMQRPEVVHLDVADAAEAVAAIEAFVARLQAAQQAEDVAGFMALFLVGMDAASEGGVAWAVTPRQFPLLALIGILVITADALYAIASTEGLLSVVAMLSSLYPAVTIALARQFLGEPLERRQWIRAWPLSVA
jgi:drug/metabolite transporter (DMT)-like permease